MDKLIYGLVTTFCMIFCFLFIWMVVTTDNKPREQSNDLSVTHSSIRVITGSAVHEESISRESIMYEENKKEEEELQREAARIGAQSAMDAAVYSMLFNN